jgi:hypothetical protein
MLNLFPCDSTVYCVLLVCLVAVCGWIAFDCVHFLGLSTVGTRFGSAALLGSGRAREDRRSYFSFFWVSELFIVIIFQPDEQCHSSVKNAW